MGQIEDKESVNNTNDLSDRKGVIGRSEGMRGNTLSSDLNIKIDDNSEANKESLDENTPKEAENEQKLKKLKTYDFACTVFYAMVAMLIFSTLSRTYTSFSGGGCGALYAAQPLLAYSCVGMACALIRSLRKNIKAQIKENSNDQDCKDGTEEVEEDTRNDSKEGYPYGVSILTSNEKLNNQMNFPNPPKIDSFAVIPDRNCLVVNIPEPKLPGDKLSEALPLPILAVPPPYSINKRKVSFQTPNEFSALSAVDLKVTETDLEKEKNRINETHGSDPLIIKNDWKDIKFDTKMFRDKDGRDAQQQHEYNWNDYNLNSIDKY